jgi:hypothetical protein
MRYFKTKCSYKKDTKERKGNLNSSCYGREGPTVVERVSKMQDPVSGHDLRWDGRTAGRISSSADDLDWQMIWQMI